MTARANSLTDHATLPAHGLGVFVQALAPLGYDTGPILAAAGLSEADFADPDGRVPCEAYSVVLAHAQRQRATPNLPLALALQTRLGAWPLLDYLVITSDTVRAGVHQLARYFRVTGNLVMVTIHENEDPVRVELSASAAFAVEYNAALIVIHLRSETDGRFAATGLSFRHAVDDPAAFARAVGCAVGHNATWSGISISREAWTLPLRRRDPILRRLLEVQAEAIVSRFPVRDGLAREVQGALARRIGGGDTRIESVGREFAMSSRTLQRRLADHGVSYQQLLEDARREAAARYLADSTLAIGEIAYLLGYSEPAPFHRAFKRWYGVTPESFRRTPRSSSAPTISH